MSNGSILVINGEQVRSLLENKEAEIIEVIKSAYLTHASGNTSLPHSLFLRFPNSTANRIIALPAYLESPKRRAGLKWIASFPHNVEKGMDRASAVLILNSPETGIPEAILEGSIISAKRTAASAALAAKYLCRGETYESLGIIGCGLINHEISRFLATACPNISRMVMFDRDRAKAEQVAQAYCEVSGISHISVVRSIEEVIGKCELISFATTASSPYVSDLSVCLPGCTVLHVSLRDLAVEAILSADNIVDDIDHVCRAETSLHLAERQMGNRDFIQCCLADILNGKALLRRQPGRTAVFSPFGLGILDLAVGDLVLSFAEEKGEGTRIHSFLPRAWQYEMSH
jgi:ornithine cyclodeaminase